MGDAGKLLKQKAMTSTVAFTLPISCQICLGKVKEPVCCNNNHVYCRACILIWTSKNKHCPTCRVAITADQPFRQLLGGQNVDAPDSPAFSQPMNRKARVKSLFNSYEDEIQRLNDIIAGLEEENRSLKESALPATVSPSSSTSGCSLSDKDRESLNLLKSKLAEATRLQHEVKSELQKYQQENTTLQQANIDLSRENDRLRYDLSQKTPSKIGRFTVAALESQIEKQRKEISNLEKALSISDQHIQTLQRQLNTTNHVKVQRSTANHISPTNDASNHMRESQLGHTTVDPAKTQHMALGPSHAQRLVDRSLCQPPSSTITTANDHPLSQSTSSGDAKYHSLSSHSPPSATACRSLFDQGSRHQSHSVSLGESQPPNLLPTTGPQSMLLLVTSKPVESSLAMHSHTAVSKWNNSPVSQLLASDLSLRSDKVLTTPTKRLRNSGQTTSAEDLYWMQSQTTCRPAHPESPTKKSKFLGGAQSILPDRESSSQANSNALDLSTNSAVNHRCRGSTSRATDHSRGSTSSATDHSKGSASSATDHSSNGKSSAVVDSAILEQLAAPDLSINTDFAECLNILHSAEQSTKNKFMQSS